MWKRLKAAAGILAVFALTLGLAACGGGGGAPSGDGTPNATWDQFNWDEGSWE